MPQIRLSIKDAQKLVHKKHLPPVPAWKDSEAINKNVKEADEDHINHLVVLFLDGPLKYKDEHEDIVCAEHVQKEWVVQIRHQ